MSGRVVLPFGILDQEGKVQGMLILIREREERHNS